MKQFIETIDGDLINLNAVSKIIYNFDYQVSLPRSDKKVSDYHYSIFETLECYEDEVQRLNDLINKENWIAPIIENKVQKIINPNKISFMTKDDSNLRIILNLKSPVSFHGDYHRMTSDFCYINCTDWDEYQRNLEYITSLLKGKEM